MGVFSFKKDDKKKKDSGEKKSKDAGEKKSKDVKKVEGGGLSTIVLKVDLHCEGCANKVKSSIRHFKCVESVNVDMEGNKLTVTGNVDPTSIKERVEKKAKKKVEIISPAPKKDEKKGEDKKSEKKDEKKDDKKGKSGEGDKKEKEGKGGDGEKKKEDGEKKKEEGKVVDVSRGLEMVNNFAYNGQTPYTYSMPMYNQSYYNQDYGVSTSNHGYAYNGYANHGYPMQYSNGPPPPPPMYLHDPRAPGMFSDEDPNAACSIM